MRKALALTLALFLLSVGGIALAHGYINSSRDEVVIREQVQYGDKSAAEGLTAQVRAQHNSQLFWDTSYTVGDVPVTSTEYSFYSTQKHNNYGAPSGLQLSENIGEHENLSGISLAYKELYDTVEPGESAEKTVNLKDYYDYYPFSVTLRLPNYSFIRQWGENINKNDGGTEIVSALTDFFKIPILDEHRANISIERHLRDDGTSSSYSDEGDSFGIYTLDVLTDEACYFTFDPRTSEGNIVDTSLIPGGYGIYCLPYSTDGRGNTTSVDTDGLRMVYPLNPESQLFYLRLSEDGTKLLLHTQEEGKYVLTVINLADMSTLQRLELLELPEDYDRYFDLLEGDGFFTAVFYDYQLVVVRVTDSGEYELCYAADISGQSPNINSYDSAVDFDGERVAFITRYLPDTDSNSPRQNIHCGFQIRVYDESGLLYHGIYTSSLDTEYVYWFAYIEDNPYTISLPD